MVAEKMLKARVPPAYGSWESAAYSHDFKTPPEEQRRKKFDALKAWGGPAQ
jgi:hypothetical protein